jgi:hypothetical protein
MDSGDSDNKYMIIFAAIMLVLIVVAMTSPFFNGKITAAFSGILVIITAIYMKLTRMTLQDNQKSRKITLIERRLEYFYYPLNNMLIPPGPLFKRDEMSLIYPYQYLATERTRKVFLHYTVSAIDRSDEIVAEEVLRNFVKQDIDDFLDELNKLIM